MATEYALQRLLVIDAPTLAGAFNAASDVLVHAMRADKIDSFLHEKASERLVAVGRRQRAGSEPIDYSTEL
jgi:hypothetical protein